MRIVAKAFLFSVIVLVSFALGREDGRRCGWWEGWLAHGGSFGTPFGPSMSMFACSAKSDDPRQNYKDGQWKREKLLADLEIQATQGSSALVSHLNAVEDLLRYLNDKQVTMAYRRVPIPKMSHERDAGWEGIWKKR